MSQISFPDYYLTTIIFISKRAARTRMVKGLALLFFVLKLVHTQQRMA